MIFAQTTTEIIQKTENKRGLHEYEYLSYFFCTFKKNRPYDKQKSIFQCWNGFNQEFHSSQKVGRMLLWGFIQVVLWNIKRHINFVRLFRSGS